MKSCNKNIAMVRLEDILRDHRARNISTRDALSDVSEILDMYGNYVTNIAKVTIKESTIFGEINIPNGKPI